MSMRYRITPARPGVTYGVHYRKTLPGARAVADRELSEHEHLRPHRVLIESTTDPVDRLRGYYNRIKWQYVETVTIP